jgi:N-acetylglucosamine-6-sulfatase
MKLPALILALAGFVALATAAEPRGDSRPNFIVILTDDQDQQMNSLKYMKGVQGNLIQEGTTFPYHYCTVSVCCPSRANMWTGKAAHNTNVTDLRPPYGLTLGNARSVDLIAHRRISKILRAGLA